MLSDRRRVERALVPGMLLTVVNLMLEEPRQPPEGVRELVDALNRAVAEAVEDVLDPKRRRKLADRCRRESADAFEAAEFFATAKRKGATCGRVYLAVSLWLVDLFDRDVMQVGDCDFTHAFEALAEHMNGHHSEVLDEMHRSAAKAALRLRRHFEGRGYFLQQQDQRMAA